MEDRGRKKDGRENLHLEVDGDHLKITGNKLKELLLQLKSDIFKFMCLLLLVLKSYTMFLLLMWCTRPVTLSICQ